MKLLAVREGLEESFYQVLKNFLWNLNKRQVLTLLFSKELHISDTYNFCSLKLKGLDENDNTATLELSGWLDTKEIRTTTVKCRII